MEVTPLEVISWMDGIGLDLICTCTKMIIIMIQMPLCSKSINGIIRASYSFNISFVSLVKNTVRQQELLNVVSWREERGELREVREASPSSSDKCLGHATHQASDPHGQHFSQTNSMITLSCSMSCNSIVIWEFQWNKIKPQLNRL